MNVKQKKTVYVVVGSVLLTAGLTVLIITKTIPSLIFNDN